MYDIQNKKQDYGIDGYKITKKYFDPVKEMKDREFYELREKNKLPTKPRNYVTKRGSFYQDNEKIKKGIPAPNQYNIQKPWISEIDLEKGKKKPHDTKKLTYVDQIINDQKKRPTPGPGKYNLQKTDEQVKKEVQEMKNKKPKVAERVDFLCEYQYLGSNNPGPGQYNPHQIQHKQQINRTKPCDWIQKDKQNSKQRSKSQFPDAGTYNAFPVEYMSFGKLLQQKIDKIAQPKINLLGNTKRFGKEVKSLSPGPGQYQMIAKWLGKEDKKGQSKDNWMKFISKGTQENRSIYY